MKSISLVFFVSLFVHGTATTTKVTPVEKVVELLRKLSVQISEEGKEEAANYDKFSCFCKDTADNKLYAIEKSTAKIESLDAKITELTGEIAELNGAISELGTKITSLEGEISEATQARTSEHEVFVVELENLTTALSSIDRAIEAMKASKGVMTGKVAKEALAQVFKATGKDFKQPGKAYESEYHSNDIIATLEDLGKIFLKNKNELEQSEFQANSAYESRKLGLTNEKTFAAKEKVEKEAVEAKKTEAKAASEADKTQEEKEKGMDQEFLNVLTADCEKKAAYWDQRSTTRAAELTAVDEAMKSLETGVAPNYGANKKLVDLQKKVAVQPKVTGHWEYVESKKSSFLQLRGSRRGQANAAQKALEGLMLAAAATGSPVLAEVVMKVKLSEDHFKKVRDLIKDMISRLKSDAQSEATTKGFCDENMKTQVTERDSAKSNLEDLGSQISAKNAKQAELESEVAALSKAVAENIKALNEATQLRAEEKATSEKTITEAGAGKDAVEYAITVLNEFYQGAGGPPAGLLQYEPFVSTDAGRDGKTVADLAPKVFDADYSGKQQESKGVIGLLEVILSDFERTETTVTEQESEAQADFEEYESETNADTAAKTADIKDKNGQVTDIKDDLVTLIDSQKDATTALALSEEELEKLKKMCVDGEESYEERVAKREKEIEALKEAMNILDNWQA